MAEEGIAAGSVMDVNTALQEVLKTDLVHTPQHVEFMKLPEL